jgi:hypothetical protein
MIKHMGGAYLRDAMKSATSEDLDNVLRAGMTYVEGCADPIITCDDGGTWSAYTDADAERLDRPTLIAIPECPR